MRAHVRRSAEGAAAAVPACSMRTCISVRWLLRWCVRTHAHIRSVPAHVQQHRYAPCTLYMPRMRIRSVSAHVKRMCNSIDMPHARY